MGCFVNGGEDRVGGHEVRVMSRSISPRWRSIRFRLALRTYTPCGPSVRVVSLAKSRTNTHPRHITARVLDQAPEFIATFEVCQQRALIAGKPYFGLEFPQADGGVRDPKKGGNVFRAGIFLDSVRRSGTTRAESPHGAHVRGAKRNRIDRRPRIFLSPAVLQVAHDAQCMMLDAVPTKASDGTGMDTAPDTECEKDKVTVVSRSIPPDGGHDLCYKAERPLGATMGDEPCNPPRHYSPGRGRNPRFNSFSFGSPRVRCTPMWALSTCGA